MMLQKHLLSLILGLYGLSAGALNLPIAANISSLIPGLNISNLGSEYIPSAFTTDLERGGEGTQLNDVHILFSTLYFMSQRSEPDADSPFDFGAPGRTWKLYRYQGFQDIRIYIEDTNNRLLNRYVLYGLYELLLKEAVTAPLPHFQTTTKMVLKWQGQEVGRMGFLKPPRSTVDDAEDEELLTVTSSVNETSVEDGKSTVADVSDANAIQLRIDLRPIPFQVPANISLAFLVLPSCAAILQVIKHDRVEIIGRRPKHTAECPQLNATLAFSPPPGTEHRPPPCLTWGKLATALPIITRRWIREGRGKNFVGHIDQFNTTHWVQIGATIINAPGRPYESLPA